MVAPPGTFSNAPKVEAPRAHLNHIYGVRGVRASLCIKAHQVRLSSARARAAKATREEEGDGER